MEVAAHHFHIILHLLDHPLSYLLRESEARYSILASRKTYLNLNFLNWIRVRFATKVVACFSR